LRVRSVTITVVACPICEDSGWKSIDVDGVERVTRCDCWRNNLQSSLLQEARIPRRYHHCQLSNFETHTDSQRTAHRKATRLVEQFPVVDKGLLFYGDAGVGKTHLAVALLKAIVERCRARALFFESRELLKMVRDTYGGGDTRELDVLRPVLEAEFLVLDDLGAEKKSEWVDETLGLIVNTRYSEKRVTVFTTNLSDSSNTEPTSFAYQLGLRTRSRLKEMCDWVHIDSVDTREVGTHPTPDDIAEWEAKSPASPKNRRGGMPSKTTGQVRAQLKTRERDGRADLKWPGGRAGSQ
jgi:DNA replication protein DnaC